jgi:YD repeat-containing protein
MKTNYLKTISKLFVPALFALAVACDEDDEAPAVVCLPTELHGEESLMKITYNDQKKVKTVEYAEYDNPNDVFYKSEYTYVNGKITTIDGYEGTEKVYYQAFEYTTGTILVKTFDKIFGSSNFEQTEKTVYYLDNSRIIRSVFSSLQFDEYDSTVFTYNAKANIVQVNSFNKKGEKTVTTDIEYDDKVNPYNLANVTIEDSQPFWIDNLSINNVVKYTYKETGSSTTEIETVTYTYDSDGKPLTRKFSWEPQARTFKYECK